MPSWSSRKRVGGRSRSPCRRSGCPPGRMPPSRGPWWGKTVISPPCCRAWRPLSRVERQLKAANRILLLLFLIEKELKSRSSPERLPHVVEGLGDACVGAPRPFRVESTNEVQLQNVLTSPQFRARAARSRAALQWRFAAIFHGFPWFSLVSEWFSMGFHYFGGWRCLPSAPAVSGEHRPTGLQAPGGCGRGGRIQ